MKNNFIKRLFDLVGASLGLVFLSPILLLIAILIKLEDKGPIFYRCVRIGLNGRPFNIIKFRSMRTGSDKTGNVFIVHSDLRITSIGNILRKYKLDELPQLINVLKGEMSIVGPRPEYKKYTDLMTREERRVLSIKPGLTDWATLWNADQGSFLEGQENPEQVYLEEIRPMKLKLQLKYVNERSIWVDIKIIFETLITIIFRKNPALER